MGVLLGVVLSDREGSCSKVGDDSGIGAGSSSVAMKAAAKVRKAKVFDATTTKTKAIMTKRSLRRRAMVTSFS